MTFDMFRQYLEHASGSGRRSTVLTTIIVLGGVLLAGLILALYARAPDWILQWILGLIVADAVLFFAAFLYFMFKNPDALRSERFELEKLAMERGLVGDSVQGEVPVTEIDELPSVSADPPSQLEGPR